MQADAGTPAGSDEAEQRRQAQREEAAAREAAVAAAARDAAAKREAERQKAVQVRQPIAPRQPRNLAAGDGMSAVVAWNPGAVTVYGEQCFWADGSVHLMHACVRALRQGHPAMCM